MEVKIICETCGKTIGTIQKPIISASDVSEYKTMFTCECSPEAVINVEQV